MRKVGFTLSEVLITLGIIGVVAALTLPALVQNNRNKELQSGLKKAYSLISQALDMYYAKNEIRINPNNVSGWRLKSQILPFFKISKDCGMGSESTEEVLAKTCIPNYVNIESTEILPTKYRNLNGKSEMSLTAFDDGQFVLADGMLILLENNTDRMYISADVNGYNKRPNRLGQDVFMFQVVGSGKLLPMGVEGTDYYSTSNEYCSQTSSNGMNGAGCTYNALTDKDYFKNLPK